MQLLNTTDKIFNIYLLNKYNIGIHPTELELKTFLNTTDVTKLSKLVFEIKYSMTVKNSTKDIYESVVNCYYIIYTVDFFNEMFLAANLTKENIYNILNGYQLQISYLDGPKILLKKQQVKNNFYYRMFLNRNPINLSCFSRKEIFQSNLIENPPTSEYTIKVISELSEDIFYLE